MLDTFYPFNSFMTGRYHIETSPLICPANPWTGFSMITASVMKELTIPYTIITVNLIKVFRRRTSEDNEIIAGANVKWIRFCC